VRLDYNNLPYTTTPAPTSSCVPYESSAILSTPATTTSEDSYDPDRLTSLLHPVLSSK
jgi:hypothetical protein